MRRFVKSCLAAAFLSASALWTFSADAQSKGAPGTPGAPGKIGAPRKVEPGTPKGAVPAQPRPGTGEPADPARPLNPKATTPGVPRPVPPRPDVDPTDPTRRPDRPNPKGAIPATPRPGTGEPADPARPLNPKAQDKTRDTPPRTGETPSRDADRKFDVRSEDLVSGLGDFNIATAKVKAGDLVNIDTAFNRGRMTAHMKALDANVRASASARRFTEHLREQGLLREGQRVVGFADGRVFITGGETLGEPRREPLRDAPRPEFDQPPR